MTTTPTPEPDPVSPELPPLPPSVSNLLPTDADPIIGQLEAAVGIKPGTATTEFWLSIGALLVNTGSAIGMLITHKVSATAAEALLTTGNGGIAGLYTLARSYLKAKVTVGNPPAVTTVIQR